MSDRKIKAQKDFWSPISMGQNHLEKIIDAIQKTYGGHPSLSFTTSDGIESECDSPASLFKDSNMIENQIETIHVDFSASENHDAQNNVEILLSFRRTLLSPNISLCMEGGSKENLQYVLSKIKTEIKAMRPWYGFLPYTERFDHAKVLLFVYIGFTISAVLFASRKYFTAVSFSDIGFFVAAYGGFVVVCLWLLFSWLYYDTGVFRIGERWSKHRVLTKIISSILGLVSAAIITIIVSEYVSLNVKELPSFWDFLKLDEK